MANAVADLSNDFDIDSFDWGVGSEPIPLHEVAPDIDAIFEEAVAQASVRKYGWRYAKRGELKDPAQKIYPVQYVMVDEGHRKFFEETWPEFVFQWNHATKHTDHPVSRLTRELNEMEMVHPFVSTDTPYIDLFGSGRRNAHYGRKCITLYCKATPKDYLSYQEPAVGEQELDWGKLLRGEYVWEGKRIHNVTLTHALYYLNLEKIGAFVNAHPLNRVHAIVHRHSLSHGTLNAGEQQYWVSEHGGVTQMNMGTGETYTHHSLEAMFHQYSARTRSGGVAWTTRKLGGDTFLVELVSCKYEIAKVYVPLEFLQPETRTVTSTANLEVRTFLHWTWMSYKWQGSTRTLENVELVESLRLYIAGRKRNARERENLWNYARRLCNERDLLSMHGGKVQVIDQALLSDYVSCAFYMDARHELEVAVSYAKDNDNVIKALNDFYENGVMPKSVASVERALISTASVLAKPISWPAQKGVEFMEELFFGDNLEVHEAQFRKALHENQKANAKRISKNGVRLKTLGSLVPVVTY